MDIESIKKRLESYSNEVKEFHPFLKNFLPQIPQVKHVEYTHGNREYGADFIIIQENQMLLKESYIGVVVKCLKIKQSHIDEIERQIKESFRMPKTIFNGQRKVSINSVWFITNQTITVNAKDKIKEYFKNNNISFIDINMLANLVSKHYQEFINRIKDDVFTIHNNHIADSGQIPILDIENKYLGYYENEIKEQFIFIGDRKSQNAAIHGGDFGWETPIELNIDMSSSNAIFSAPEILWISNCYSTMTGISFNDVFQKYIKIFSFSQQRLNKLEE